MTEIAIRKQPLAGLAAAVTLAIGLVLLSAGCYAAEPPGSSHSAGLPEMLASVTVLSDAAMANEKGNGLQAPAILNDATGHARVMLWDELKVSPLPAPAANVTINTVSPTN